MTTASSVSTSRLRVACLVVAAGYLALAAVSLVARSTDPTLWTWTAGYAVAGVATALVLGGPGSAGRPVPALGTGLLLLTVVLAAVVAGVGGLGGLALAVGAYPAIALWLAVRRTT